MFSALMVCLNVFFAGPISGFGMNPARSLASAVPSGIYTDFWIYLLAPVAGMLLAAEVFLKLQHMRARQRNKKDVPMGTIKTFISKPKDQQV